MKEMMARAKAEKEASQKSETTHKLEGKYHNEGNEREFFDGVAEKA